MKMEIAKQTKEKKWKDESGVEIPADRISVSEKLRENKAYDLAKDAIKLNALLTELKENFKTGTEAIMAAVRQDNQLKQKDVKETKGNLTWFNFNRSIKVECSINEQIAFDDMQLSLCKEKLDEFLNRALHMSENAELISRLVKDAFSTTRGNLDAKKVMNLLKYEDKVESLLYKEAMKFLRESIRKPGSKTYYRLSVRNEEGGYDNVNLNFSSI